MKIAIVFDDIPEDSELYKTYKSHKITIEYDDVIIDTVALNNAVSEIRNEYGIEVFKECKLDMSFDYNEGVSNNMNTIKFVLNGCDISFVAEAPEDMTVRQLVEQADRIKPNWCACGICKADESDGVEIIFDYNDVITVGDDISCTIKEN